LSENKVESKDEKKDEKKEAKAGGANATNATKPPVPMGPRD